MGGVQIEKRFKETLRKACHSVVSEARRIVSGAF
jgi:hypothetical protein